MTTRLVIDFATHTLARKVFKKLVRYLATPRFLAVIVDVVQRKDKPRVVVIYNQTHDLSVHIDKSPNPFEIDRVVVQTHRRKKHVRETPGVVDSLQNATKRKTH
jgi:hypothetical protein